MLGGPNSKSLRLRVPIPHGRRWTVDRLDRRAIRRQRRGHPNGLSPEARAALLELLQHATDVELDAGGLTVWALRANRWTDASIDGVTGAAALVPHVHRVARVARLLLAG